ncbi:hypothetical protein K438DRAFT_861509 [Mycena galopus ATCC 62051]|nr:hypothetical protein K438DRAFT_861509 [Mycena galopus ATCC 62051]
MERDRRRNRRAADARHYSSEGPIKSNHVFLFLPRPPPALLSYMDPPRRLSTASSSGESSPILSNFNSSTSLILVHDEESSSPFDFGVKRTAFKFSALTQTSKYGGLIVLRWPRPSSFFTSFPRISSSVHYSCQTHNFHSSTGYRRCLYLRFFRLFRDRYSTCSHATRARPTWRISSWPPLPGAEGRRSNAAGFVPLSAAERAPCESSSPATTNLFKCTFIFRHCII